MKIAVDLDGVCYEFQRTYRYMIREYRGVEMPPVDEFWTYWDAQMQYGTKQDHDWMWGGGVKKGLFRYGHMITGARRGLEALVRDKHKIIIVTHRPENAVSDTLEWAGLYFKGIPLSGFHVISSQHPKTTIPWDVLIDDKPENIQHAEDAGRIGLLFNQPWNESARPAFRLSGWNNMPFAMSVVQDWAQLERQIEEASL